ncbi:hypothetical protein ABVK25_003489 [Lepraria finkii]|uniref:Sister chromatid cohesion protein Dcc1 n=1 Tax=Lepraria finkii TaxID=1340010 RepID=A0ABR4BF33_9LECA
MSTQEDSGVPFEMCNGQQHLRLLELPSALLEQITSKRLSNLTLKSATPNSSSQTSANAVLCTDNQTYRVRQVQSSNSIYVLQPSETSPEDGFIPTIGLSAIAQCTATLELIPEPASATPFLKQTVPVYSGPESGTQLPTASAPLEKKNKHAILERAPCSLGEFNKACEELCVFEVDGQAWLPTASMLANVWKSIISGATMRSVNLGEGFSIATLSRIVEEDGHPTALFRAVMDRLSSNDIELMDDYAALSREKAVPWVGLVLLQSHHMSTEAVLLSDFLQDWQNQLLEDWRNNAKLDALKGKYSQPGNGRIVFDESGGSASASSTPAKSGRNNTRKWHEKFKNARR